MNVTLQKIFMMGDRGYNTAITFGINSVAKKIAYHVKHNPMRMYRGVKGALVLLPDSLVEKIDDKKFHKELYQTLTDKYYSLHQEKSKMHNNQSQLELLIHFFDVAQHVISNANFNISPSRAKSWAGPEKIRYREPQEENRGFFAENGNISFVLSMKVPDGQEFWEDIAPTVYADRLGFMTQIPCTTLTESKRDELLFRVGYDDGMMECDNQWNHPSLIRDKWEPIVNYTQRCVNNILMNPNAKTVDLFKYIEK